MFGYSRKVRSSGENIPLPPFKGGFAGFGVWVDFDSRQVREVHREAT